MIKIYFPAMFLFLSLNGFDAYLVHFQIFFSTLNVLKIFVFKVYEANMQDPIFRKQYFQSEKSMIIVKFIFSDFIEKSNVSGLQYQKRN